MQNDSASKGKINETSIFTTGLYLLACLNITSFAFLYFYWGGLGIKAVDYLDLSNIIMSADPIPMYFAIYFLLSLLNSTTKSDVGIYNYRLISRFRKGFIGGLASWAFLILAFFVAALASENWISDVSTVSYICNGFSPFIMLSAQAYYSRHQNLVRILGKRTSLICITMTMTGIYCAIAIPALERREDINEDHGIVTTKSGVSYEMFGKLGDFIFTKQGNRMIGIPITEVERIEAVAKKNPRPLEAP